MLDISISESKQRNAACQDWSHCRYGSSRGRGRRLRRGACRFIVASKGNLFGLPSVVSREVVLNLLKASNIAAKQRGSLGSLSCTGKAWSWGNVGDNFSLPLLDCWVRGCRATGAESDSTSSLSWTKGGFGTWQYPWTFRAEGDRSIDCFKIFDPRRAANRAGLNEIWPSI